MNNGFDMGCPTYQHFELFDLNLKRISKINPMYCHLNLYDMHDLVYADMIGFKLNEPFVRRIVDCEKLKILIDDGYVEVQGNTKSLIHVSGCSCLRCRRSRSLIV